jgi:hypothetical protein
MGGCAIKSLWGVGMFFVARVFEEKLLMDG